MTTEMTDISFEIKVVVHIPNILQSTVFISVISPGFFVLIWQQTYRGRKGKKDIQPSPRHNCDPCIHYGNYNYTH